MTNPPSFASFRILDICFAQNVAVRIIRRPSTTVIGLAAIVFFL
jgi:hypothetical protein